MKPESITKKYTLKVLSPLHVGYGDVYDPANFILDAKNKELLFLDMDKLLLGLSQDKIVKFSAICKQGEPIALVKMYRFMANQLEFVQRHPEVIKRKIKLAAGIPAHFDRVKNLSANQVKKGLNKFEILSLAYNPNTNQPIIPGSSIKGALRTAILNFYQDGIDKQFLEKVDLKKRSQTMEQKILGYKYAKDDILKRIKISDFVPVEDVKTKIVYAVNVKKGGRQGSGVYQLFEVIEPGTVFKGSITVVKNLDKNPSIELSIEAIEKALSAFFGKVLQEEDKVIQRLGAKLPLSGAGVELKVGRHSGAEAVTVEKFRHIKINQGKGREPIYLSHSTTIWLATETARNYDLASAMPFGRVSLESGSNSSRLKNKRVQDNACKKTIQKQPVKANLDFSGLKQRFKVK